MIFSHLNNYKKISVNHRLQVSMSWCNSQIPNGILLVGLSLCYCLKSQSGRHSL